MKSVVFSLVILLFGHQANALDSADVLPAKINSPAVRMGVISGVGQRYTGNGSLTTLNDYNAIHFDVKKLIEIEPRVQQLVDALNQFGQQRMGSALTLGTLKFDIQPEVNYIAPVHAYGITEKWTIAVGVPIVRYANEIGMYQTGSNLAEIKKQAGGLSTQLDEAFDELSVGLPAQAQKELATKGYKPLGDRRETFLGDVQLVSLYKLYDDKRFAVLSRSAIGLPTGPGDDPDDLADLGAFGYTSFEQAVVTTYRPSGRYRIAARASARYTLPDDVIKRVPLNEDDSLPDASTKERVHRVSGVAGLVGLSGSYFFAQRWSAGLGYDISGKMLDRYSGSQGHRYDLLDIETDSNSHRIRAGFSYDTTAAYFAKQAMLPSMISYEFSDTIRGFNTERQTVHELWLTLFF